MAYPDGIGNLPADPNSLSPESLGEFYGRVRTALTEVRTALGDTVAGSSSADGRIDALELANSVIVANTRTSNYVLVLSDAGKVVEVNSTSNLTVTVPPNSSVAFPIGTVLEVCRLNTGTVTLVAGSGVTLNPPTGAALTARVRYSTVTLRQRDTNIWIVGGDLS